MEIARKPKPKETVVYFTDHQKCVGMIAEKNKAVFTCRGVEPYTRKDGAASALLIWEGVRKSDGNVFFVKTSTRFRMFDLQAPKGDL
jgi:hypothetical protein